jgi:hypothetical protein
VHNFSGKVDQVGPLPSRGEYPMIHRSYILGRQMVRMGQLVGAGEGVPVAMPHRGHDAGME